MEDLCQEYTDENTTVFQEWKGLIDTYLEVHYKEGSITEWRSYLDDLKRELEVLNPESIYSTRVQSLEKIRYLIEELSGILMTKIDVKKLNLFLPIICLYGDTLTIASLLNSIFLEISEENVDVEKYTTEYCDWILDVLTCFVTKCEKTLRLTKQNHFSAVYVKWLTEMDDSKLKKCKKIENFIKNVLARYSYSKSVR